ncbi:MULTISPECIES: HyaD/HybD family hydrogenase maturation endopeptidase [Dehalococcoides]|jgi:hydrogenase maturation protease|uniref:Hydrogenase maturation protease n=2 Tax=Dehalococcoides mccartyi TaxID=61435 RepID=A0A142V7W0_9CHLR|nr:MULTISPECIES: HyaD/HybD family hydrogenase maturation endopeptidase [Dehalococcoides]AGG05767.1 hydrogenase maturation protease [Dehalococcoides mccartyi DCMB5]AGG07181.1 hydrogenase maturation protease [Dehalococcoides mccartyi BTF08]AII60332.1 hydrogenase maturation protease [Dehalococcoides mccartyi CG5]AMU85904.1 Ni/Fe hydrogenase maturation protease [Dehalococcoides mccartyi]AOV98778.1 hydrogenase maturation protease [Dehalococcoides mccartyi]
MFFNPGDESPKPILVLGTGNILLSDEGAGVRCVERLSRFPVPEDVELYDGGTAAMDLLDVISGREKMFILDAVHGGDEPGMIYRFRPEDIKTQPKIDISFHQMGLMEILNLAKYHDAMPKDIIIYGIQPGSMAPGFELTPAVDKAVNRVVEMMKEELGIK